MERFLTQIVNMFFRKAMRKGMNAGIDHLARKGKPAQEMTAQDHEQAKQARALAKRAQQMARLARRLGR